MKKIILVLILFSMGCDEDPIFGLERGWLYGDDNETSSDSNDVPPDYECDIIYNTNGSTYDFISPNQTLYRYGDSYTVTLHSNIYSVGQVSAVYLYLNRTQVYSFGTWLLFPNNSRVFTLPGKSSGLLASNCYTIIVLKGSYQYVSESFTIY